MLDPYDRELMTIFHSLAEQLTLAYNLGLNDTCDAIEFSMDVVADIVTLNHPSD